LHRFVFRFLIDTARLPSDVNIVIADLAEILYTATVHVVYVRGPRNCLLTYDSL